MVRQVKEQPAVHRPCRPCCLAWQPAQSTPARAIQSLPLPLPGSRGPGAEGDSRSHILLYALCWIRKADSLDAVVMWTAFGTVLKVLLQHLALTPSLEKQCPCWGPSQAISSNRQGRVSQGPLQKAGTRRRQIGKWVVGPSQSLLKATM